MAYHNSIKNNSTRVGNKTANLIYLAENTPQELGGIQFEIPEFFPLDHDSILQHLKKYIPNWDTQWEEFAKQQSQENGTTLNRDARKTLKNMREGVIECFKKHPLALDNLESFKAKIGPETMVMVRSTGKEDSIIMANPGGNESKACVKMNDQELSSAIGEVVASYLSEKSLLQRLKSGDNITTEPFVPVLIQKMIGNPEKVSSKAVPRSGVAFSDQGYTRINAAPGHGELVVNSKGNTDSYYITNKNKVYAEIRVKEERLESHLDSNTGKSELRRTPNSEALKYSSSLPEAVIVAIHRYAQSLEQLYHMRMDIEFVYDPSRNTVCIVQARPIPIGDRYNMKPSAVPPHAEKKILSAFGHCLHGHVITPEVTEAALIKQPGELLICDTINEALSIYLSHSPEDNSKVKAVIIKKPAPDTSHEAGEFSSKAIPVIQLDDLTDVKKWRDNLSSRNNPGSMIIDLQRKSVYQIPNGILPEDLIQEGIFCSTLSAQVSPFEHDFSGIGEYKFSYTNTTDIPESNLADLLALAQNKALDPKKRAEALEKLLDFEFHLIESGAQIKQVWDEEKKHSFSIQALKQALLNPNIGENNQNLKDAVCYLMNLLSRRFKKNGKFTLAVKEAMHSLAEVYIELDRYEKLDEKKSVRYRSLANCDTILI